jgi:hypothetical protein
MLTFFDFISTIQGCSSMRQGVARRGHSFSRLQEVSNVPSLRMCQHVPAFDKILEVLSPFDTILGFILEFRDRLSDDVG